MVDANGGLVGIVTEGDFLRRGEIGTQRRRPRWLEFLSARAVSQPNTCGLRAQGVRDLTPSPHTVGPETSLDEVVRLMERHRIKRLPVVEGASSSAW